MRLGDWYDRNAFWIFPSASVVFIMGLMIFPLGYTIYNSFTDWSLTHGDQVNFVGLKNYIDIFLNDDRFWGAVGRTIYFTGLAMAVEVTLGVLIAVLFDARDFRGKRVARSIFLMAMMATPVAVAMVWMLIFEPTAGVLNYLVKASGLEAILREHAGIAKLLWITDSASVIPSLVLVDIWEWTPLISLIVIAGLATLSREPYESAMVDGATPFQIFFRITLPMIAPTIGVAALLRLVDCLKTFDIIYVMTMGGPGYSSETLNIYTYQMSFQYFNFGYASALLVVFFVFVLGVSLLVAHFRRGLEL
ncbi:MAG: sugar ABC transporter permease [Planctomycetota bacterium]|jgi:multiple sugar transport system permease protein|nr:sugar ABC transporter permease [Planctomycetota bacterium]